MKKLSVIVISLLLFLSAISFNPVSSAATQSSQGSISWITAGKFLNYSINGNANIATSANAGSNFSLAFSMNGTLKVLVNSLSNGDANLTIFPNMRINESSSTLGQSGHNSSHTETTLNSSSTYVLPLNDTNSLSSFENRIIDLLNSSSISGSMFSPALNISVSQSPAALYKFNTTTLVALHLEGNLSESQTHNLFGIKGPYSLRGSMDEYYTLNDHIPLYVDVNLNGSGSFSLPDFSGNSPAMNISTAVNFSTKLLGTNVNLGPAQAEEGSVNVPSFDTNLYIVSNDTLQGVGTSGNKLIVNVSGPSGTQGVLNVLISQNLLSRARQNISQVAVSIDGSAYSNYTITQFGGDYLITVYYHHSSHEVELAFGNANFGNNIGTVSQISISPDPASTETIAIAAVSVVVFAILVSFGVMKMRRRTTPVTVGQSELKACN